jgi:hypothetical protein
MTGDVVYEGIAPVIPVRDLGTALDRYRRLGFDARPYEGDARYGFVNRDSVWLHLSEWTQHDPSHSAVAVYVYVSDADADAVHSQWEAAAVDGRLADVHDTEYGLREFAYVDSDGTLHRVGSRLGH